MDLELLQFRAKTMQAIRSFFCENNYLELDTPSLSSTAIPENCLEVFQTTYHPPWSSQIKPLILLPSPELYIKKIIAQHAVSVFQLSKCYRNIESVGNLHSPEFTMLEYYTMNASYRDSMQITENLMTRLLPPPRLHEPECISNLRPPFATITLDEAFYKTTGIYLHDLQQKNSLAALAKEYNLAVNDGDNWDDLFELIFVHRVEPCLANLTEPKGKPLFLLDYPAQVPCLAQDKPPFWKERWELYYNGIELANCYSEQTNPQVVKTYFEQEGMLKNRLAKIPHAIDSNYWKLFSNFPPCSGVALGVDRLLMVLCNKKTITSVLPFNPVAEYDC